MPREYAFYHVAFKVLLKKGDEILFLRTPDNARFDLPGGRIDVVEDEVPLEQILDREIKEELGNDLQYKLGKIAFQFRRHFPHRGWHIFLTAFEAEYCGGEIQLSDEHSQYIWINPRTENFQPDQFLSEEEYRAFKKYFNQPL